MALVVPQDIPGDSFTRAGLLAIDGSVFQRQKKVSTDALSREIETITKNVAPEGLQTKHEWQQVRNVCLVWCFSDRTESDNTAINALLRHVGLKNIDITENGLVDLFGAIEARHNESLTEPMSPAAWIKQRPPPQRLPTTATMSMLPPNMTHDHMIGQPYYVSQDTPDTSSFMHTPKPVSDLNSNPQFQGKYNFTDHKQEYEGYQFQCIFRCLKDGKHCRKAPVREMNRHLRDRHQFRQGFKIAGVDWERKRWRGAGADHKECVGKIVEKDSADDSEDEDESDLEYTMDG